MKHSVTKDGAVFLLEIQHRQNATWQGSITWVERQNERQNKQYFRSALELIKLIDSALEQSVENKREGEESGYEEE